MVSVPPANVAGKLVGPVVSSGMTTALELRNPSTVHPMTCPTSAPQPCGVLPAEAWVQVLSDYSPPNGSVHI